MIDYTLKFCTYVTTHPTGFRYTGKATTAKVVSGSYYGSGIRLACILLFSPEFARNTWTTTILGTYATEEEAFAAEEALVPLDSLKDPWVLNDTEGGRKGKYRTRNTIIKSVNSAKRAVSKKAKADKTKAKIEDLKKQLKEKK